MDINHLLTFKKVVDYGGFSAAALSLGLPKSSISQKVGALERELGVRLLQRTTRRVSLTEIGERVYESAARIAGETEEVQAAVVDAHAEPTGVLRITAPHDFGTYLLGDLLRTFLLRHPKLCIDLDLSSRVVDLVSEGIDLALRATSGSLVESSLIARSLSTTELGIFASPSWLSRNHAPEVPEDLRERGAIFFSGEKKRRGASWKLRSAEREVEIPLSPCMRTNDFLAIKKAAVAGMGIAALPALVCRPETEAGQLIRLLPDWNTGTATFYAVYPSRRYLPAKTRALVDFLQKELASS